MSVEIEENSWGSVAILVVVGLILVVLIWRSYENDAPRIATYQAPPVSSAVSAPQVETAQSLGALAESHFTGRRYAEAAQIYRKILALDPKDAAIHIELGLALHYSGKPDEAVDALKKATTLDPKLQRAWLSYGFVLMSLGREQAGRAALEKTVALNPGTPQGLEATTMLKR